MHLLQLTVKWCLPQYAYDRPKAIVDCAMISLLNH